MLEGKRLDRSPVSQHIKNWVNISNAEAKYREECGEDKQPRISLQNAQQKYAQLIKGLSEFGNKMSAGHNMAFNALKSEVTDRGALERIENYAQNLVQRGNTIVNALMKAGVSAESASASAFNSIAGSPNFDHFVNLTAYGEPLYEQKTFISSMIDEGDAYALPIEPGGMGSDKSRFRAVVMFKSGSAKTYQGDVNPFSEVGPDDSNGSQIDFQNEFKNVKTEGETFFITQTQRDQLLGLQSAATPGLSGILLQNFLNNGALEDCMRNAEINFVDGQVPAGSYQQYIGGDYGLLSSAIALELASAALESPIPATATDWVANPTKLVQQITNFWYKPASTSVPLSSGLDVSLMYKEVTRLFNLYATLNVNAMAKNLTLYVPTTYYGFAVQYLGVGTFNRQLNEAIHLATGGLVQNIQVKPSGLLGARTNIWGQAQVNYFALVAHGAPNGKKGMIFPGQTTIPQISSKEVSQDRITYRSTYLHGGPMILQTGQVFLLKFANAA